MMNGEKMVQVPLASVGLRSQDIAAAYSVLTSGNLTMGEKVKAFETEMQNQLGAKHFIMVNSGSSANLAIVESLLRPSRGKAKLSAGDSVLVPAVAWPTTIWPLVQLGLDPVFVDVDPETLALDLNKAEEVIHNSQGKKFAALFPIHPLGLALEHSRYLSFANKHGLLLINDTCEALGASFDQRAAGTIGIAGSYSFYFSHHMTTMEGGGIATDDDLIADDLRSIRSHGWSRDRSDASSYSAGVSDNDSKFLFISTGYNIRPMEIQAAIGLAQLPDLPSFINSRREIAQRVYDALAGTNLKVIDGGYFSQPDKQRHSWMLIPIKITGPNAESRRKEITAELNRQGIETRPVLTGNFLAQPSVRNILGYLPHPDVFPVATQVSRTHFLVGAHHDLTEEQISHLTSTLRTLAIS